MQTDDSDKEEPTKEEQASMEATRLEWLRAKHLRTQVPEDPGIDAKTAWYNKIACIECTRDE